MSHLSAILVALLIASTSVFATNTINTQNRDTQNWDTQNWQDLQDWLLCPAELTVIQADARKLTKNNLSPAHRRGLENRINSALATLVLLCRRYSAIVSESNSNHPVAASSTQFVTAVGELTLSVDRPDKLVRALDPVTMMASFRVERFTLDKAGGDDEAAAGTIYHSYCHACHSSTNHVSENPAFSLHDMAKTQTDQEFFARMLLGIRGTPEIGLSNPLTPIEIGAMTRYLRSN